MPDSIKTSARGLTQLRDNRVKLGNPGYKHQLNQSLGAENVFCLQRDSMIVARHEVPGVTRKIARPYIWTEGLPRRGSRTQPRVSTRFQPWESSK
jgi:hypothetical protein